VSTPDIKLETSETNVAAMTRPSYEEIVDWCKTYIGKTLGLAPANISADAEFEALGFDSSAAVALVGEAEIWLSLDLEPAVLFEYPTISAFAKYLSER
jgi:acyl carrier protein